MVIPVEHFISMSFKYDAPFNIETYEKKEEKKKKIDKITCMCYPYEVINQQMFKNFLNIREFSFFFCANHCSSQYSFQILSDSVFNWKL